jgi:hypothetical protein
MFKTRQEMSKLYWVMEAAIFFLDILRTAPGAPYSYGIKPLFYYGYYIAMILWLLS